MIDVTRVSDSIEFHLVRARRSLLTRLRDAIRKVFSLRVVFISVSGKDAVIIFNDGKVFVQNGFQTKR